MSDSDDWETDTESEIEETVFDETAPKPIKEI